MSNPWLPEYTYRKAINIGSATGAGTNYQVKVIVQPGAGTDGTPAGTVYLNSKCLFFPNDIAFTDASGNLLKYWYEYDTNNFWVKVTADLGSAQTIYLYYGSVTSLPNPTGVPPNFIWKRYGSNPVFTVSAGGAWDNYWVQFNSIWKDGTTYYGYYQGCQSDGKFRIGLATSLDGVTWARDGVAAGKILDLGTSDAWDDDSVGYPMVWKEGLTWYMMYSGRKASTGVYCIGLATSADGLSWTKDTVHNPVYSSGAAWDNKVMEPGTVMVKEGSTYYMYYWACNADPFTTAAGIGLATSTDLITWTPSGNNPLLNTTGHNTWDAIVLAPTVIKFGTTYYMWYEGVTSDGQRSRVGLASSSAKDSGWSRLSDNPVLNDGQDAAWDNLWSELPVLVQFGNEWRMYYGGSQGGTPRCKAGYATFTVVGDGPNTFLFFDDFTKYGIDTTKWDNTAAFLEDKSDIAYKYAANTNLTYILKSLSTFSYPLTIECKAMAGADWANEYGWVPTILWDSAWATTGMLAGHYKDASNDYWKLFMFGTHNGSQSTNGSISASTWYKLTLQVLAADQYFNVNGTQKGTTHLVPNQSASNACLATNRSASGADYTSMFDWIFVRKMPTAVTEPAISSFGSEQYWFQIDIGGAFKKVSGVLMSIGGVWKNLSGMKITIGGAWKDLS